MVMNHKVAMYHNNNIPPPPSFTLILGCERSGKTTKLFQVLQEIRSVHPQCKCILIHGKGLHSQFSSIQDFAILNQCIEIDSASSLDTQLISRNQDLVPDIVAVDEAQCMQGWEEFCKQVLAEDKHLIATMCVSPSLSSSSLAEHNMATALALATYIHHQRVTCGDCGRPESGCHFDSKEDKIFCGSCYQIKGCAEKLKTKIYHSFYNDLKDKGILFGDTDTPQELEQCITNLFVLEHYWTVVVYKTFEESIIKYSGVGKTLSQTISSIAQRLLSCSADKPPIIYNLAVHAEPVLHNSEKCLLYQIVYYYHEKKQ